MTDTEHCSCGSRQKSKCVKESTSINGVRYGKMCLKPLPDFTEGYIFPERMKTFTPDDWVTEWEKLQEKQE